MAVKAFFSHVLNDFVVDAACECGHLERDHGSQLIPLFEEKKIRIHDGGNCCVGSCNCSHFRWARWVTASEFAENMTINQSDRISISS